MVTINHEYFVSPEIAKLLKEAGFYWRVRYMYRNNNPTLCICTERSYRNTPKPNKCPMYWQYAAPTLDVAQKWLREVKDILLYITPKRVNMEWKWNFWYIDLRDKTNIEQRYSTKVFNTYEEAQEAGIKKCLEEDSITNKCSEE